MNSVSIKDLSSKFTTDEQARLGRRLVAKQKNAADRGLECNLTMEDMFMIGFKLLGHGACDYTNLTFSTLIAGANGDSSHPRYPTIERIDDTKGYVRGNICVVMQRANQLKDNLLDKKIATTIVEPLDREIVKSMMLYMSQAHMESLKTKYIPNANQPEEEQVEETMQAGNNISVAQGDLCQEVQPEECLIPTPEAVPEDVAVALAYSKYCTDFSQVGMKVSVSFAQFKAKYIRKVCSLTGAPLDKEPKHVLILDLQAGFAKDNFLVVDKKISDAVTSMMIATGMSVPKIAAMFNKAVK